MSLWSLITDLLTQIPPVSLVFPNEGGVFLRGGKLRRVVGPGFYWKIPWYDRIMKVRVVDQVINLATQTVECADGVIRSFGLTIRYEISYPDRAILNVLDYDDGLQNLAMSTLASFVSRSSALGYDAICGEILEVLQTETEEWGLEVNDVGLTDLCRNRVIRLLMPGEK